MGPRLVSAIMFSPRGGSAHVARALIAGLRDQGWEATLVAGSRGDLAGHGDARAFYGDVQPVDFSPALASAAPLHYEGPPGSAPIHPSFEDRPDAPDVVFAKLDELDYERQVRAWSAALERAGARQADVLFLHHLTPLNEAAARVAPDVPVVSQLHGTELLMLEQIVSGPPSGWRYAERWVQRLRHWSQRCSRLVVAPGGVQRAVRLLVVDPERMVPLPNGVDVTVFKRFEVDRQRFWRRVLVEQPQGAAPGQGAGSIRYEDAAVRTLAQNPILLYVGRFTAVKRLDLLIGAFARAQSQFRSGAGLVLVGGHPGEWEGEHPATIIERDGLRGVFLAGWHGHEQLPEFFSAADAVVLASEREQFGQVLAEGMACRLPAVASRSMGPATIIEDGRTGWLVRQGDAEALASTLAEVARDHAERTRRGRLAERAVRERFAWPRIAAELGDTLERVIAEPRRTAALEA